MNETITWALASSPRRRFSEGILTAMAEMGMLCLGMQQGEGGGRRLTEGEMAVCSTAW